MMSPFIPSTTEIAGARAKRWVMILHGILGKGANWRSFAKRLVEAHPQLGCVLVDLRMHGGSQTAPPPHTLHAAAGDIVNLVGQLRRDGREVDWVIGHSFGGKVAALCRHLEPSLSAWVLDASLSADPDAMNDSDHIVARVIHALETLPATFATRDAFIDAVVAEGIPKMIGQWQAMNLERDAAGFRYGIDLSVIRTLIKDYYAQDLWHVTAGPSALHIAIAERGTVTLADRNRYRDISEAQDRVVVHDIPDAGHWLHIDATDAVLGAIVETLAPA